MTTTNRQLAARSITVGGNQLHRDGAITTASHDRFDPEMALADVPLQGGGSITKEAGAGGSVFIHTLKGAIDTYRQHRNCWYKTTKHTRNRKSKPLPKKRLIDRVLEIDPGVQNVDLSVDAGIPTDPSLLGLSTHGEVEVTLAATRQRLISSWGMNVPPTEIVGDSGTWTFTLCRRYLEVRRGEYFDRLYFDGTTWMRSCQITRLPLNENMWGLIFRPDNKIIAPASPYPLLIDAREPFRLLRGDGTYAEKHDDWWVVIREPSGRTHELIFFDNAWRIGLFGSKGYTLLPVLSEKQDHASCQGILEVWRSGDCRINGCGLLFSPNQSIDIQTPDLRAWRAGGASEMLTISDGDSEIVARFKPGLCAEYCQWFVGGRTESVPCYASRTPYVLMLIAAALVWMGATFFEHGAVAALRVFEVPVVIGVLGWGAYQAWRAVWVVLSMVRNFLHGVF